MWRNKQLRLFTYAVVSLNLLFLCLSSVFSRNAMVLVISICVVFDAIFFMYVRQRYIEIKNLSSYLMQVYTGHTIMDIRDNQEGELSVLKNDLYKVTQTLQNQAELLLKDKTFLADSLSDISHQLKTPLTSMTILCDLLSEENLPLEKRQIFTQQLYTQLDRMQWLIVSLLKLSKIDAKAVTFKEDKVKLKEFITHCIQPFILININTKKYIVTGIFNDQALNQFQAGYEVITGLKKGDYQPENLFTAKINMKDVSNSIYSFAEHKLEELDSSSYYFNSTLLLTYGVNSDDGLIQTMNMVIFIVGCLILIGSVSLIYNAFAISLAERSRYLGMLSSVGATKHQKRNSVFYEAFMIGCIAIPIGFLFGYAGMWITFKCIDGFLMNIILEGIYSDLHLRLVIDMKSFLAAFLFSALILFISAWRPAVRASKISPIDAIRQSNDIQIKARHMKTWKCTRTLFGLEAELALKNMKRNKSRYNATLFSLIMSIVLFLSVSFFQQLISKSFTMYSGEPSSSIITQIMNYDGTSEAHDYIEELVNVEDIQSSKETFIYQYNTQVPSDVLSEDVLKFNGDNRVLMNLIAYDDVTFEAYCKESGIDVTTFQNDTLQGILVNQRTIKNGHEYAEIQMFNKNIGDQFSIEYSNQSVNELMEIPVALTATSIIAEPIISDQNKGSLNEVSIIISKQAMDHFLQERKAENADLFMNTTLYFQGDASTIETNLLEVSENQNLYQTSIYNRENAQQQQEQMLMFVSIFLYGFVFLMLLISITNIFNTISTGVMLRKQEFAMLKSVGITPKGFRKLLIYENMFYAIKSLLYGIPISIAFSYLLYLALNRNFAFAFFLPLNAIIIVIVGIFSLVMITMLYSIHKVKNDNIVETIRNESI